MPRAHGPAGMVDVFSVGVAMDWIRTHYPCIVGGNAYKSHIHGHVQRRFDLEGREIPENSGAEGQGGHPGPHELCRSVAIDSTRAWLSIFASMLIIAFIFGLIHSYGVFVVYIMDSYKTGMVETIVIGCLTYGIIVGLFNCLPTCLIRCMGSRLVAVLGLFLVFLGLLIDSFCLHWVVFYLTHLVCFGIGGLLAVAAAMSLSASYFRAKLRLVLFALVIAVSLGSIFFIATSHFLLLNIGFRWTKVAYAVFGLIVLASCYLFPAEAGYFERRKILHRAELIKRCIRQKTLEMAQKAVKGAHCDPKDKDCYECEVLERHFSCIIVSDCSVWYDFSFILWATLGFFALAAIFFPYIYLIFYAIEIGILTEYSIGLILFLCLGSLFARFLMILNDYSFTTARLIFQLACILSAVLLIVLVYIKTYGWLVVWAVGMGASEGLLIVFIPRLTLATIPTKWLGTCWTWILIFHALGIVIGAIFIIFVKSCTGHYIGGFITVGILQIIAAILAWLLPNEEEDNAIWVAEQAALEEADLNTLRANQATLDALEAREAKERRGSLRRASSSGSNVIVHHPPGGSALRARSAGSGLGGSRSGNKHVHFQGEEETRGRSFGGGGDNRRHSRHRQADPMSEYGRLLRRGSNLGQGSQGGQRGQVNHEEEARRGRSDDETARRRGKSSAVEAFLVRSGSGGVSDQRERSQRLGGDLIGSREGSGRRGSTHEPNPAENMAGSYGNSNLKAETSGVQRSGSGQESTRGQDTLRSHLEASGHRGQAMPPRGKYGLQSLDEFGRFRGISPLLRGPCTPLEASKSYEKACPICLRIGCIPECCPCTPGGLAGILKECNSVVEDPCSPKPKTPEDSPKFSSNYSVPIPVQEPEVVDQYKSQLKRVKSVQWSRKGGPLAAEQSDNHAKSKNDAKFKPEMTLKESRRKSIDLNVPKNKNSKEMSQLKRR